jgi:hypothetical protein
VAAVIEDALRRQRRRRIAMAIVIAIACAATAIAVAVVASGGRGRSAAGRPGQQVSQAVFSPDGHYVVVLTQNARVLKVCVPSGKTSAGIHVDPSSGQIWIAATNGSKTIRLSGTPQPCRA